MAELALGALGLVPLLGLAIKSYRNLGSKLKTYRHFHKAIARVRRQFRIQRQIFENECELMLRLCLEDEALADAMVTNTDHDDWKNEALDRNCKKVLVKDHDEYIELINDILEAVKKFESELDCFEAPHADREERTRQKLKPTLGRVTEGLKMTLNKSSYESNLDELRTSNKDLTCLREQMTKLKKSYKAVSMKRPAVDLEWRWADIRLASTALYKALVEAWSCSQASHVQHVMRLFLDAESSIYDGVRLKIGLVAHSTDQKPCQADLIHLQVQSESARVSAPRPRPKPGEARDEHIRKRAKAVRFSQGTNSSDVVSTPVKVYCRTQCSVDPSGNLRRAKDFCSELTGRYLKHTADEMPQYVGHLDFGTRASHRHLFYTLSDQGSTTTMNQGQLMPVDALLCTSQQETLSHLEKLKIARSLASAVLNFHKTPWLGELWRLQDLSFFYHNQDISRSLRTLHVRTEFTQGKHTQIGGDTTMNDVSLLTPPSTHGSQASEDEWLLYGIDNPTLYCLGVALLQIERAKQLDPGDMLGVRKMAKFSSSFGRRYREMAEQCLRCDFGYGADLSDFRLQQAVYDSVVGKLDSMIAALEALEL